jgi:3-phosphoshikimate 1-carboxyvinyltransferase
LLVGQALLRDGETCFVGSARLGQRPHTALFDAIRAACGEVLDVGDPWPVIVRGARPVGSLRVAAEQSSQPLSALLLYAAGLVGRDGGAVAVEAMTPVASAGYLELTLSWMARAGVTVVREGARFVVARVAPQPLPAVPADWSSIAYLLLAAWASGGVVEDVDLTVDHPDRAIVEYLAAVGLAVDVRNRAARVHGALDGALRADVAVSPDLALTLAALACALRAPSSLHNVGILRHKESDRLDGVIALVRAAGGVAALDAETLTITPGRAPAIIEIDARGDHRMAMAAAVLALVRRVTVVLDGAEEVRKSFPGFWHELARVGVRLSRVAA